MTCDVRNHAIGPTQTPNSNVDPSSGQRKITRIRQFSSVKRSGRFFSVKLLRYDAKKLWKRASHISNVFLLLKPIYLSIKIFFGKSHFILKHFQLNEYNLRLKILNNWSSFLETRKFIGIFNNMYWFKEFMFNTIDGQTFKFSPTRRTPQVVFYAF